MKILILENDSELYPNHPFTYWVARQRELGHEIKMVTNAYNNGAEIIEHIEWPDRIAFTSTFIYIKAIYALSLAIAQHRKRLLEMWIMNDTLPGEIERLIELHAEVATADGVDHKGNPSFLWSIDENRAQQYGHALRHVVITQFDYNDHNQTEETRLMHRLHHLAGQWQMKLDEDLEFRLSRQAPENRTGRMVRIRPGILQSAPGKEWSKLKPGMLVHELSMIGASERVSGHQLERGAWVMGLTEPVKLLNDDPGFGSRKYDEFEYVIRDADDLVLEILKMCGRALTSADHYLIMGVIQDKALNAHYKATTILDEFELPRRQNRAVMEKRIEEWEQLPTKISRIRN